MMGNTASSTPPSVAPPIISSSTVASPSSLSSSPSTVSSSSSVPDENLAAVGSSKYVFPEPSAGNKDDARLHRLKRPNSIKEKLYQEWSKQCLKECDMDVRRYWICRQENGLLTPFKCRSENQLMKDCLQACGENDEKYTAFRTKRLEELEADYFARQAEKAKQLSD